MASAIDANVPVFGNPTTESVRQNFAAARDEITDLLDRLGDVETGYLPLAGGTLTGLLMLADDPALPLGAASRRFVESVAALRAPLASPAFTGNPTAPTPAAGDDSTRLATTAFVKALGGGISGVTAGVGLAGGGTSGAVTLNLDIPVAVAHGGTGLSGGTAGGLLYFNTAGTLASSAALGLGLLLTRGGAGGAPAAAVNWSIPAAAEFRGSVTGAALGSSGVSPALRLAALDNGFPGLVFEAWGTGGGFVIGRTAGGTGAAPAATPANANLLTIAGRGYDTAYSTADAARIRFYAAETHSATGRGAGIDFFTTQFAAARP